MSVFHGKALLIDQNLKLSNDLKEKRDLLEKYPFFMARTFKEAEVLLKNEKYNIRIVFLSTAVGSSHGLEEMKLIRELRPAIPFFFISYGHRHRRKNGYSYGISWWNWNNPQKFKC